MGDQNTILDSVWRLVGRLQPTPVCDRCVADRLEGVEPMEVQIGANELAVERGYLRDNDACGLCGEQSMGTRKQR